MSSRALRNPPVGCDDLPVDEPAWHKEILDARLAEHEAELDAGRPWEEVEAELRASLAARR